MIKKPFVGTAPDYSESKHWLARPDAPEKPVDLIFLYPSSCNDSKADVICTIDNRSMVKGAARNLSQQAAAFEPVANIFAPFWRQVNATKLPKMSFEEVDAAEWAEPRTDVYAALDYYFEHLNQGRPFFLAGHSQGSRLCYIVLSEYMKAHPERYANMIAAYAIGDSLTRQYLEANPHVRAARAADDLGVVVSWNTEGPANRGRRSLVVAPGAVGINPLNWRTDDTPAGAELNLGSFMPHLLDPGMDELPIRADAVLDLERGSVMVTNPAFAKYTLTALPGFEVFETVFGPASYHGSDYSFFYLNIRENARLRAETWCNKKQYRVTNLVGIPTDYSNKDNWAHLPGSTDRAVDTFFVYPTVYNDPTPGAPAIVPIENEMLRAGVANQYLQAPLLFEDLTNLYEPYYRQSNLFALFGKSPEELLAFQLREQRTDLYAALDYYFEHFNQGRPFILAGHSQGSLMLKIALQDYFKEHADYLERMVAAYVLGFSITTDDLANNPALKFAEGADDTGVIVSWNTEGPGNKNEKNGVVLGHSIAINPLNWRRDDTYAPASENLGDRLPVMPEVGIIATEFHEHCPGLADAQLDLERGVVVSTTMAEYYVKPPVPGMRNIFGPASLHVMDYPAFWENIHQNVKDRISAYFKTRR